jgi:hypothetical protein
MRADSAEAGAGIRERRRSAAFDARNCVAAAASNVVQRSFGQKPPPPESLADVK